MRSLFSLLTMPKTDLTDRVVVLEAAVASLQQQLSAVQQAVSVLQPAPAPETPAVSVQDVLVNYGDRLNVLEQAVLPQPDTPDA